MHNGPWFPRLSSYVLKITYSLGHRPVVFSIRHTHLLRPVCGSLKRPHVASSMRYLWLGLKLYNIYVCMNQNCPGFCDDVFPVPTLACCSSPLAIEFWTKRQEPGNCMCSRSIFTDSNSLSS